MSSEPGSASVHSLNVHLERDGFMRTLIRHLAGALSDVVGNQEANGFFSLVGAKMGDDIRGLYLQEMGQEQLTREQLGDMLCDLKRRIQGDFYVIEETEEKIIFGNRRCPFGDRVKGRPAMCMMTSNVFGSIAADTTGYSKVDLEETIAEGHDGCRIVVHLKPTPESLQAGGREYFKA